MSDGSCSSSNIVHLEPAAAMSEEGDRLRLVVIVERLGGRCARPVYRATTKSVV